MKTLSVAGAMLLAISMTTAAAFAAPPPAPVELPDGPGKAELQGACLKCHSMNVSVSKRTTKDGWTQTVVRMQGIGAEVSDDDIEAIASYLAAHFGLVMNVNKATEQQYVAFFSMSPEEAAVMVKYRAEHGEFKSLDDLLKVPNVDTAKIQAQSGNITFQDVIAAGGAPPQAAR